MSPSTCKQKKRRIISPRDISPPLACIEMNSISKIFARSSLAMRRLAIPMDLSNCSEILSDCDWSLSDSPDIIFLTRD